jgi:hypothetical protein
MTVITAKSQKSNLLKLDVKTIQKMYQDGMSYRERIRFFNKPPSMIQKVPFLEGVYNA